MASNGSGASDGASYTVPLLINGEEITTSTTFPVISPSSHKTIWHASSASVSEAKAACDAASAALPAWRATKPHTRRNILLKAADILDGRAKECSMYMKEETGSADAFTDGFNLPVAAEILRDVAGRIAGALQGSVPICEGENTQAVILKEPFGVVLGIAPWNAPYVLGIRSIIYALAAGNTTILKGSELSPRVFWAIGSTLTEAGLPKGCLNVVFHRPQDAAAVTSALIEHPAVKKVNFTGSTAVGSIIASQCGKALKPCLMELGGKASAIVLEDANLDLAATQVAVGAFLHSGQICMSTERILVHESVIQDFRPKLQKAISTIFPDDGKSPILITGAGVKKNKELIGKALAQGASLLHGDHSKDELHPETQEASATRMRPIVVDGINESHDLYHTESFGPSVSLISVPSEQRAIEIANDTEYGLSGAVFTNDLARGLRVAAQIETGAVHINSMTVHDEPALPHGGAKKSGWGRFNSSWGLDEFLRTKTVTFQV